MKYVLLFCDGSSAGISLGFYLSMFVLEICKQTWNIYDHGVESVNQTEKSNIKLDIVS